MAGKAKAKPKAPAKPQTPAEPKLAKVYDNVWDKLADEAKWKGEQVRQLGEGVAAMLRLHPEWTGNVMDSAKTLDGALGEVRKNAKGGCSDPVRTTESLCGYYGIPCGDYRGLALEVTMTMMKDAEGTGNREAGGTTSFVSAGALPPSPEGKGNEAEAPSLLHTPVSPDPFDLDALLGVM